MVHILKIECMLLKTSLKRAFPVGLYNLSYFNNNDTISDAANNSC